VARTKSIGNRPSSISAAFVEHNAFLKKFVARYLSSQHDIEDVVQEAYLRAYLAETQRDIDQPKAFLFRIAKNVALTNLTKKSRQITEYLEDTSASRVTETEAPADLELAAHELLGLYCEAIATLSEKCREVFLLRKIHGLSHKEIAERMSLSVSSVEKYLRQGILTCDAYVRKNETPVTPKD
jgi:RNA polymerase sigma factor (sigma-70 family)